MNRTALAALAALLCQSPVRSEPPPNPAGTWVATDGLGRALPTHADTGDLRPDRTVGVFYYVWVGNHTRRVRDIGTLLKQPKDARDWGPDGEFHFWGEPEYGYYHASDPWVIRRDMQMLANAGVDFIFLDVTNTLTYPDTVRAVLRVIARMRAEGVPVPAVTFATHAKSGRTMNRLHEEQYESGAHDALWFRWQGKPLMLGEADDPDLRPGVRDYFTIKKCWVGNGKPEKDTWNWLAGLNGYGYAESPDRPEQVSVTTAFHPENPLGKSYHQKHQPGVGPDYTTEWTGRGLYFDEQWRRALDLDPRVVMVTQWNEWIAQRSTWGEAKNRRKQTYGGRPISLGDPYFVDVFSPEFSRDIAPMKGGYTDNYYYQMVANVRRYKGTPPPPPRPARQTMTIDGDFAEWDAVPTYYYDPAHDTDPRDFEGTDPAVRYTNATGRNDIVGCRVVRDAANTYFCVSARESLTAPDGPNWMLLFVDADQDKTTGWEGYDYLLNRNTADGRQASVEAWDGRNWTARDAHCPLAAAGRHLELQVPDRLVPGLRDGFDFKWADNPQHLRDASAFFLDGDAAPDRRFDYRY